MPRYSSSAWKPVRASVDVASTVGPAAVVAGAPVAGGTVGGSVIDGGGGVEPAWSVRVIFVESGWQIRFRFDVSGFGVTVTVMSVGAKTIGVPIAPVRVKFPENGPWL